MKSILGILFISLIGLFLRLENLSPFKFYPDAYQNLIVALNIQNYGSIAGYLGEGGMFYPPFFMWTRPVYPLLINLFTFFGFSVEKGAITICLLTSLFSIPLVYFFISRIFKSKLAGLTASLLLAISFNHVVWSGFVYTEAPAIFFNLLFLTTLTYNLSTKTLLANKIDLLSGFLFSLAIFSRYEYAVLTIPVIYLIYKKSPTPLPKLINIFIGCFFGSTIILTQLFPVSDLIPIITAQLKELLKLTVLLTGVCAATFLIFRYLPKKIGPQINSKIPALTIFLILIITSITVLQIIFGPKIPMFDQFSSMKKFFLNDYLIAVLFLTGTILLLRNSEKRHLAYFSLLSIALLWPIYNKINPDMQRYWTHLLPFILLPASYPLYHLQPKTYNLSPINWKLRPKTIKYIFYTIIVLLGSAQTLHTFNGMKNWNNGDWTKVSYEEKSAKLLVQNLKPTTYNLQPDNLMLITSMPESYFFYSRISTNSVADKPPYIFIDETYDQKTVLLVQDEGMRDLFPTFNNFIDKNLSDKKLAEYYVGENYHFAVKTIKETQPVKIYQLPLQELKQRIQNH